jgi:RNA polymerase sigma-70 factor (ECF subfamily)
MDAGVDRLWEEFSVPLRKFIQNKIANEQDAEDILQEVFIKVHQNIGSLMDDQKIHGWIYSIARNTIIDFYRLNNRKPDSVELPEDMECQANDDPSANAEIAACLKAMIDNMPENYKQALLFTEFYDMTQRELSNKLGISSSCAKSRVQRARKKLKDMLLGCCHLEFDRRGNVIDYQQKNCNCKYC